MSPFLLTWAVLAFSFFNTISLYWLGLMVLLAGNRRSGGAWLTGSGLLLGALFFTSHTAILGRGLDNISLGMDLWWWISWTPAVTAPLAWYGAMLWYSGFRFGQPHPHRAWAGLVAALGVSTALLLIFANPLPSYQHVAGRDLAATPSLAGIPLLILAYLLYSLLCYLLPLDLLRHLPGSSLLESTMRRRARPWLAGASLALLASAGLLAWTALWALSAQPLASLADATIRQAVLRFDLAVEILIALAVILLGRAVVGFEAFTGRTLPRSRFSRQWRSTVILALGFGLVTGWMLALELRPVYSLMLATVLMTVFYALYAWRSFEEREQYMARLRPFVASQNLYEQMTRAGAPSENPAPRLLQGLCQDVLEVRSAYLVPSGALAALAGPPLIYPPDHPRPPLDFAAWAQAFQPHDRCLPIQQALDLTWAVPLWSSRGLDGILFLGEKRTGAPFTEEEIEIAQAAGERLLDLLAGSEMARVAFDLLRQRLAQSSVLEGQGRRLLHDEVLPQLHTALLHLSSLQPGGPEVRSAMNELSETHRRVAALMRALPLATPQRLAQHGLAAALQAMVEHDFRDAFKRVEWHLQPEAADQARALPLFISEVLYFSARELVRNAARHAPGPDPQRAVGLVIRLEGQDELVLSVEDNGVGFHPAESAPGSGLRIHSAMLAAAGARLEVLALPEGGTRATIQIKKPAASGR